MVTLYVGWEGEEKEGKYGGVTNNKDLLKNIIWKIPILEPS